MPTNDYSRLVQWVCRYCFGEMWLLFPFEPKTCAHCMREKSFVAGRGSLAVVPVSL
jgi:hypothetical protein